MLILAAEAAVHADADVAAEREESDNVLIFLVEKICRPRIQGNPTGEFVAGGQIEACVAGIPVYTRAKTSAANDKAEEIAVGAHPGEITRERNVDVVERCIYRR